jgi:two-component system LytT family response regulator
MIPLPLRVEKRLVMIHEADVRWLEAMGHSTRLHSVSAGAIKVGQGLSRILGQLAADRIMRIHRSTAVNLACIREMRPKAHGDWILTLDDSTVLILSRSARSQVLAALRRM